MNEKMRVSGGGSCCGVGGGDWGRGCGCRNWTLVVRSCVGEAVEADAFVFDWARSP